MHSTHAGKQDLHTQSTRRRRVLAAGLRRRGFRNVDHTRLQALLHTYFLPCISKLDDGGSDVIANAWSEQRSQTNDRGRTPCLNKPAPLPFLNKPAPFLIKPAPFLNKPAPFLNKRSLCAACD
jgi:hypothetical protein